MIALDSSGKIVNRGGTNVQRSADSSCEMHMPGLTDLGKSSLQCMLPVHVYLRLYNHHHQYQ